MNKIILVTWGGIGDVIICTPAIKAFKETYQDFKIVVYCLSKSHYDVLRNNPNIDSLRLLKVWRMFRNPIHLFAFLFNRKLVKYTWMCFQPISPSHIYQKSIKEIAADMLKLKLRDSNVQIFLSSSEMKRSLEMLGPYKNIIIMHIHSRSSQNHHWSHNKWVELIREMPDYTFVQLGLPDELHVEGAIDLRGKTSLREAFALIKCADSFVGIDSNFSHVTNAFDIPGVVLFGDSDPLLWGHENNINIYKKVECSPCYYYLWNEKCPYDHSCMTSISVREVKEALLLQLSKKRHNIE